MLIVVKPFDFYHDGVHRTHYGEGPQDLPEDAARVALTKGWAVEETQPETATVKPKRGKK